MFCNRFQVFTREGCANADEIIGLFKTKELDVEVIDVISRRGDYLAQKNGIMKLPTVLVLDNKGNSLDRLYVLREIKELINS